MELERPPRLLERVSPRDTAVGQTVGRRRDGDIVQDGSASFRRLPILRFAARAFDVSGAMSVGRSSSLPLWNVAPARP